uniref:POU class 2 homeobox 2 n=1 Tax=Taeniopygia guttata TaxID=59729 RepID=A0A674HNN9_TAEGU
MGKLCGIVLGFFGDDFVIFTGVLRIIFGLFGVLFQCNFRIIWGYFWDIFGVNLGFLGRRGPGHGETLRQRLQPNDDLALRGAEPQLQKHVQAETAAGDLAAGRRWLLIIDRLLIIDWLLINPLEINRSPIDPTQPPLCKLKPLLETWLRDAESMSLDSALPSPPSLGPPSLGGFEGLPGRRRKKRTSIETNVRFALEKSFLANQKPTSEEILGMAEQLHMEKEVIRVWFCNRRQKEKRINPAGTPNPPGFAPNFGLSPPRNPNPNPNPPNFTPNPNPAPNPPNFTPNPAPNPPNFTPNPPGGAAKAGALGAHGVTPPGPALGLPPPGSLSTTGGSPKTPKYPQKRGGRGKRGNLGTPWGGLGWLRGILGNFNGILGNFNGILGNFNGILGNFNGILHILRGKFGCFKWDFGNFTGIF